jgi:hypothetical protein
LQGKHTRNLGNNYVCEDKMKVLKWTDIREDCCYFSHFFGYQEMLWMRKIWSIIEKERLNEYSDDLERHQVFIRLFTIIVFKYEFFKMAREERFWPEFSEWADIFDLNNFRLGQLLGADSEYNDEEVDDCKFKGYVISELIERARPKMRELLVEDLGENYLFTSFWLMNDDYMSSECDRYEDLETEDVEELKTMENFIAFYDVFRNWSSKDAIISQEDEDEQYKKFTEALVEKVDEYANTNLTSEKTQAYYWISNGMYRLYELS